MSELRINGFKQTEKILKNLLPFIKFKKKQAEILLKSVILLQKDNLKEKNLKILVANIVQIQSDNYVSKKKRTKKELLKVLGLTP